MISREELKPLEQELNSPKRAVRKNALAEIAELCRSRKIPLEPAGMLHNMHCHTCYSYNGYGYAPSYIAYLAKKSGWLAAGIIDFDVLDAVEEFRESAEELDVNYSCGIETRVFIKELADVAINSPGEPGIAYHLGLGFDTAEIPPCARDFSHSMVPDPFQFSEVVHPVIGTDAVRDDEVRAGGKYLTGQRSGVLSERNVGGQPVARHQAGGNRHAAARRRLAQHAGVRLAEHLEFCVGGYFETPGDCAAVRQPGGLVGGAEHVGMRRKARHPLPQ